MNDTQKPERKAFSLLISFEEFKERFEDDVLFDEHLISEMWDALYEVECLDEGCARVELYKLQLFVSDYLEALDLFSSEMPKKVGRSRTVFRTYILKCLASPETAGVTLTTTLNSLRNLR